MAICWFLSPAASPVGNNPHVGLKLDPKDETLIQARPQITCLVFNAGQRKFITTELKVDDGEKAALAWSVVKQASG